MSGGSHGYVYCQIESELCGQMHDKELDDLMWDVKELAHDLEWMDSSDISPEKYAETVRRFKQKWFGGDRTERLQGYINDAIRHTRDELVAMVGAEAPAAVVFAEACHEEYKEHKQLAEWLEELRDRRSAPGREMISRKEAIEAVRHDLVWLGSRDGPAAVSALMRLRVFDPVYELNKRYPGYSVLPRDCIERTLGCGGGHKK